MTNTGGPLQLLVNQVGDRNHHLHVRLVGREAVRDGTGARVALMRDGRPTLWRRAHTDGSYLSASDIRVHFGLGEETSVSTVGVEWPGGRRERWAGLASDTEVVLTEGSGEPWPR